MSKEMTEDEKKISEDFKIELAELMMRYRLSKKAELMYMVLDTLFVASLVALKAYGSKQGAVVIKGAVESAQLRHKAQN